MGDVIEFPGNGEIGTQKALRYFESTYRKAGLDEHQIAISMAELEPIVRSFLVKKEFEFNLSGQLNADQISAATTAHNLAMNSAIQYFGGQLWLALCNIAGLIGREASSA